MTTESASRECKYGNAVTCLGGCDVSKALERGCWRGPNMARNANSYLTHLRPGIRIRGIVHPRSEANRRGFLSLSYTIVLSEAPILRQRSRGRMGQDRKRLRAPFARFSPEMHLRRTWVVCCTCIISTRWYAHFISRPTLQ